VWVILQEYSNGLYLDLKPVSHLSKVRAFPDFTKGMPTDVKVLSDLFYLGHSPSATFAKIKLKKF